VVVLFFAFSIPAARLTYGEAISEGLLGDHRVAIIAADGARYLEMAEQATLVRQDDGRVTDARALAAQAPLLKGSTTGAGPRPRPMRSASDPL
jgi:hypothetical protein